MRRMEIIMTTITITTTMDGATQDNKKTKKMNFTVQIATQTTAIVPPKRLDHS